MSQLFWLSELGYSIQMPFELLTNSPVFGWLLKFWCQTHSVFGNQSRFAFISEYDSQQLSSIHMARFLNPTWIQTILIIKYVRYADPEHIIWSSLIRSINILDTKSPIFESCQYLDPYCKGMLNHRSSCYWNVYLSRFSSSCGFFSCSFERPVFLPATS